MFRVRERKSGRELTVYAVIGMMFLFYENGCWIFDAIEHYEPAEV